MHRKKRKIGVITGSRADYGLLHKIMQRIKDDPDLALQVFVTGAHFESRFGLTYKEIVRDGFRIDAKINIQLDSDTDAGIAKSLGLGVIGFGRAYQKLKPDILVVLGDRFEILAAAVAAAASRIPIAHIHGGEVTEGAYDDAFRHAITKLSFLHFTSHNKYRKRIIQMGEDPKRVFNYGAPGLDNIADLKLLDKSELEKHVGLPVNNNLALVTFHPETYKKGDAEKQAVELISALNKCDLNLVFTLPNADSENKVIYEKIVSYVRKRPLKAKAFESLGYLKYLSLLRHVGLMIGNSSSGIIEAPSFRLPVVNIGNRQRGRIRAGNVIDAECSALAIEKAIKKATSSKFREKLSNLKNPFGDGKACRRIVGRLKKVKFINLAKKFYDL